MSIKRILIFLTAVMLVFVMFAGSAVSVFAASVLYEKNGSMNHREWGNICLHALDVSLSSEQVEKYRASDDLEKMIIDKSSVQVRKAPDYQLENTELTADVSGVKAKVNDDGYPVRITLPGGQYIDITVTVKKASAAASATKTSTGSSAAVVRAGPSERGLVTGITGLLILSVLVILFLTPNIKVITWHHKLERSIGKGGRGK